MKWVIFSYLILNPLFFAIGVDQRVVQEFFFRFSSFAVFFIGLMCVNKKVEANKLNISIAILSLIIFIQYMLTQSGGDIFYNYLAGLLVYITIIRTLSKKDIKFVIRAITYVGILAVVIMTLQRFGFDWRDATLNHGEGIPTSAFFFQLSALGTYLAQTICITLPQTWLILLFLLPMKQGLCAGAFMGVGAGIMFYYWFRQRIVFWILLPILIVGGIYFIWTSENIKGLAVRLPIWANAIQDINRQPYGRGLDSYANPKVGGHRHYKYDFSNKVMRGIRLEDGYTLNEEDKAFILSKPKDKQRLIWQDHPHNEYIWLAYECGLQALLCLGFIFYFMWGRFYKSMKEPITVGLTASLLCFAVIFLTQFNLHISRVGHLLPVLLGLFYVSTKTESEND